MHLGAASGHYVPGVELLDACGPVSGTNSNQTPNTGDAALLEWETIDAEQIDDIMAGKPPRPPKPSQLKPSGTPDAPADAAPTTEATA